jgi:signal transduction histidine kinase
MNRLEELESKLTNSKIDINIDEFLELNDLYSQEFSFQKALDCLFKAQELAQESKNETIQTECTWKIGLNYWQQNDYKIAQDYFLRAIPLYKAINDRTMQARLTMAVGVTHLNLGEFGQAIELLRKAIFLMVRLRAKLYLRTAYNWLGISYSGIQEYQKAMKYYLKGLALQEETGSQIGIANAKNSIGLLHLELENNQKAAELIKESLLIREELDDKEGIADSLSNLGMIYHLTDPIKSLEFYNRSLDIRHEIGGASKLANTLNNIGNVQFDLKNFAEAIKSHREVLKIREETGNKYGIVNSLQNLALSHIRNNEPDQAKKFLDKAIEFKDEKYYYKIYDTLTEYYKSKNDFQKALESFEKFTELKQEIASDETAAKIIELQTKYDLEKHQRENRISQLKNIELQNALDTIKDKNEILKKQSEHLQLISRILRHDVTNNLSVIYSAMRLYHKENDLDYIQEIPIQVEKSFDLIKKLSKVAYLVRQEHFIEEINVNHELDKVIQTYRNIDFEIEGDSAVIVHADFILESVFDNLISNAIKHGQTDKIKVVISTKNNDVTIDVIDFGKGIPEQFKDKVFDESFMYGASGNTGLGLFIVKKAVENYGGSVSLRDNLPQGTIFTLKLKKA